VEAIEKANATNEFEALNRYRKAARLAVAILRDRGRYNLGRGILWDAAARNAGVTPPSDTTKDLVVELLAGRG